MLVKNPMFVWNYKPMGILMVEVELTYCNDSYFSVGDSWVQEYRYAGKEDKKHQPFEKELWVICC